MQALVFACFFFLDILDILSQYKCITKAQGENIMKPTDVFHKITLPNRKSRYSAWFAADPISGFDSPLTLLLDCERIDALGRCFSCTDKEMEQLANGSWSASHHHKFKQ